MTDSVLSVIFLYAYLNHESSVHELRLSKLSETIVALNLRMDDYLQVIGQRSNFYRTCQ